MCADKQTAGWPSRNQTELWPRSHLCMVLPYCEVRPLKWEGGREGGTNELRAARREKVKRIDLLSWIGDLTADGPQSLEAVADGVDVGHSHKHHLTVGVVLYTQTHVNNVDGGQKTTTIVTLNDTDASYVQIVI